MKTILKIAGMLAGLATLMVILTIALMPWMDRWGASEAEIAAAFPGDELVPSPRYVYNRVVTVNAAPEEIYPWLVQIGAEKGGWYSYEWFETNILRCEIVNADRNRAIVLGHQENGTWLDVWQFVLVPQADGSTLLLTRGRETKTGTIWDVIRPGQFIMERGMLLGIKQRAEAMAHGR
jgi:hypothetical protein